jgi:capsular polysaccharide transport system permease protein
MTIWTRRSRLTTPHEQPEIAAVGWSGPVARPPMLGRLRRWARRYSFLLAVVLPTLLAAIWLYGFAAAQFGSEGRFLVRARQNVPAAGGIEAMMQSGGFMRGSEDAMGVRDYLESHDVVAALRSRLPLIEIFRRPEADPIARLWWENPTAERLQDYFQRMVKAQYDQTSGITTISVKTFRPEDSQALANELIALSEELVNRLNNRLIEDGLRVARGEVARAEARLTAAQAAMTEFRDRERSLDPTRSAAVALENLGRLEGALAQARAELAEATRFSRTDTPRMLQLRNRVEALNQQAADERSRISSSGHASPQQLGEYERLAVERDLARTQLASATASLEKARADAQRQQIFLLRVVEPNQPEWARYPKATETVLYIFLCLSVGYGLAWLLIAGMREHAA